MHDHCRHLAFGQTRIGSPKHGGGRRRNHDAGDPQWPERVVWRFTQALLMPSNPNVYANALLDIEPLAGNGWVVVQDRAQEAAGSRSRAQIDRGRAGLGLPRQGGGAVLKFLLTSSGISNKSIQNALVDLLGKPIAESSALVIPTAAYYFSQGPSIAYRLISGKARSPLCELGWKSLGVLELTALPSVAKENWIPLVQSVDALLVGGGDPMYLCDWMRQSGFAELLASLRPETVYVGVSAGSMAVTPSFGETYNGRSTIGYRALSLVDFSLGPHMDHPDMPDNSMAEYEKWAAGVPVPTYGIDDQTAIKAVDGTVEVVSEGHWKLFAPEQQGA